MRSWLLDVLLFCALLFPHWDKQHSLVVTYSTAPSLPPPFYLWSLCIQSQGEGGAARCQLRHLRCIACHGSYWYGHTPHIIAQEGEGIEEERAGAGGGTERRRRRRRWGHRRDRGLFTAGEDGTGRGGQWSAACRFTEEASEKRLPAQVY